jgi:hypothetical protein
MKDELSSQITMEFVGLKPKMYSLKSQNEEKKTAKGVSRVIVKRHLRHADYKNALITECRSVAQAYSIISTNHVLRTVAFTKSTLCPFDTKRYVLEDATSSLAYGHYKCKY